MSSRIALLWTIFLCGFAASASAADTTKATTRNLNITWVLVEGGEMPPFYISSTEVTFTQYDAFCDATGREKPQGTFGRGRQPVVNVNIPDAQAFCAWLSGQSGQTVRLPTQEEWVYAAEGGNRSESNLFSGSTDPDDVAWFGENSGEKNHEVATKKPNELGIYDMSGNVWEMCPASGVLCGGSSMSNPQSCFTSGSVDIDDSTATSAIVGFRVVRQK